MADFIKDFWEKQGETHKDSHKASWGDHWAISLEIEAISQHIQAGNSVLEAGCANGYSLLQQYEKQPKATYHGTDYAESMIRYAEEAKQKAQLNDEVTFSVGDITALDFPDDHFDVVYTTRVLINLPTWELQQQGIQECLRVAKPGGKVIFSEAFWEPLCLLNAIRQLKDLPPMVEHDFNRYLKKARLEEYLEAQGLTFDVDDFCSLYYLGTRVLRELLLDTLPPFGNYDSPVNQQFFELEKQFSGGGFGVQQAYIVRKKA